MTIKALIYGGIQIGRMKVTATTDYDGVYLQFCGTTLEPQSRMYKEACCSFNINPSDALEIAVKLIRAAEHFGEHTDKQVDVVIKRLAKSRIKK